MYDQYDETCRTTKNTFLGFGIAYLILGAIVLGVSYMLKVRVDKAAAAQTLAGSDDMGASRA